MGKMTIFEVNHRLDAVEAFMERASERGLDERISSDLAKLGSVLICGNIERCVELIILKFVSRRSSQEVSKFFASYFKRGTNYDCENVRQLLYRFHGDWGSKFEQFMNDNEQVVESIKSCYSIRNSVAHGGGQTLSIKRLKQYFDDSCHMIDALQQIVK